VRVDVQRDSGGFAQFRGLRIDHLPPATFQFLLLNLGMEQPYSDVSSVRPIASDDDEGGAEGSEDGAGDGKDGGAEGDTGGADGQAGGGDGDGRAGRDRGDGEEGTGGGKDGAGQVCEDQNLENEQPLNAEALRQHDSRARGPLAPFKRMLYLGYGLREKTAKSCTQVAASRAGACATVTN
jgi:hypothetical protein